MSLYSCLRRLGFLAILLAAMSGCTASGTAEVRPSAANTLTEHAEFVHRASAQHEQIWGDFWNPEQGFILFLRHGPALLYTHSTPLPGGTEIAPHTYVYANGLERLTDSIYLRYPLPDTTVTAVTLQSTGEQTAGLLFHEAFHRFQSTHFKQRMEARFVSDDIFDDAHVRALLQMRREVLKRALTHLEASETSPLAQIAALQTIDNALRESLGDAAIERLYQLELIEGSAELVGLRAQLLSLPTSSRQVDLQASLIASLKERLTQPPGSIQSASDMRFYAYGVGAASSFLLAQMFEGYQQTLANELFDQQILSQVPVAGSSQTLAQLYDNLRYSHWLGWAGQ